MKLLKSCVLIIAVAVCAPAHAELTVSLYNKSKDDITIQTYITGVGRGIFWANVFASNNKTPIFCMPPKLSLDDKLISSLLDQELRTPAFGKKHKDDQFIELVMTIAFVTRFPCNDK